MLIDYASANQPINLNPLLGTKLGWLRRLLLWQIELSRQTYGPLADDEYRGLYVPSAEIDILASETALPEALEVQRFALELEREELKAQSLAAAECGAAAPLQRLAGYFGLTRLECDLLLLALAPELDLRFERIFAYIQDDVTKKRPTVDLALRLFCLSPAERVTSQLAFEPDSALLRHELVHLFEDGQRHTPLLGRFIKLDNRIVAELRGGHVPLDSRIAPFVTLAHPSRSLDALLLPSSLMGQLRQGLREAVVLGLQGGYGSGRRAIAEALCAEQGIPLLSVALDELIAQGMPNSHTISDAAEQLRRIVREGRLRGAAILWQSASSALDDEQSPWRRALLHALDEQAGLALLALDRPWEARGTLGHKRYLRVEVPPLSYSEREALWRRRLGDERPDDTTLAALASTFRLSGGQIRDAANLARSLSKWNGQQHGSIDAQALYTACRAQSSGKLDALAHRVPATYGWDDIVLPPDQLAQLREICVQVRHRRTVLEQWGFDRQLAMGKGVNVLFAGPSGTGKTMAAEIVAADLHLELYKVDLSTMVSKYIGETEKNLDKIFTAAREANAILFFDEADALFGKRSEVKDAHDRYANIEVGYLLQKMEEFDGVAILATNLRNNLDDAFVRRLHVAVDFPFPEADDRLRIWRKVIPREAPLAADANLALLAERFKLAGGNIRNAALLAAYLAAEDGTSIGMAQLIRAVRREYQKLGRLVTEAEFGQYLDTERG